MKPIYYDDGTPSREYVDWETTGEQEMNALYAECKQKALIYNAINELDMIILHLSNWADELQRIKHFTSNKIGKILELLVQKKLKAIQKELSKL